MVPDETLSIGVAVLAGAFGLLLELAGASILLAWFRSTAPAVTPQFFTGAVLTATGLALIGFGIVTVLHR
ncbi:MAG: hypothetical protein SVW77_04120 [Candidatus Nanohaloarchaea archaeon]|nr:hypothetical protein [Candidatus Nanohaloarchaea archaeon]